MRFREKVKIREWMRFRGRQDFTFLEFISSKSREFKILGALILVLGCLSIYSFGFYSLPTGIFVGGITIFISFAVRAYKDLATELQFIDWEKVDEFSNSANT